MSTRVRARKPGEELDLDGYAGYVALAAEDPDAILLADEKALAEESFAEFTRVMWSAVITDQRAWGWAFDAITFHLEAVTAGDIRRLLINVPPGFSKSALTNVFWPAWEWGPKGRTNLAHFATSHDLELATEQNRLCRELITSPLYVQLWGDRVRLKADQKAKKRFLIHGGGFRAVTAMTSATGGRGHRMVVDDPHSVLGAESAADRGTARRSFSRAIPSRLKVPDRDAIVVIGQRVHVEDVSSMAIRLGYTHLCLPMRFSASHPHRWRGAGTKNQIGPGDTRTTEGELLCEARYPARAEGELRDQLRLEGGVYAEAAQLDQAPIPEGGQIFPSEDEKYRIIAAVPPGGVCVRGWDFAATKKLSSKYSAGVKLWRVPFDADDRNIVAGVSRYRWVIEHVDRFREHPLGVRQHLLARAEDDGFEVEQSIPRDPAAGGQVQTEDYAAVLSGFRVHTSPETGSKADRAAPLAAQAHAGNLYLVQGEWNAAFIAEAKVFSGDPDRISDQIDGASRAFARLAPRRDRSRVGGAISVDTRSEET